MAQSGGVDAQVLGILFAKEQGVERFDEQQGACESDGGEQRKQRYLLHRHTAEIAQSPNHVGMDTLFGSEEIEQRDGRRRDVANHDADDEQHDRTPDQCGAQQQYGHHSHGSGKGCQQRGHETTDGETACRQCAAHMEHHQGNTKTCTAVDAEDGGAGKRIAECRLQQQSAGCQCTAAEAGGDGLRQSGLQDDVSPTLTLHLLATQDVDDIADGYWHRTQDDVEGKEHDDGERDDDAEGGVSHVIVVSFS